MGVRKGVSDDGCSCVEWMRVEIGRRRDSAISFHCR